MTTRLTPPPSALRALRVIEAINAQNEDLDDQSRQEKYAKMAASPFIFYRGTNHLFWADFAGDPRLNQFGDSPARTWLQGDLHVENFGAFSNDEGDVVYNINDFDEAVIADYQYDLWRMAVSIVLVAQEQGDLSRKEQKQVVAAFSRAYLDTVADYCAHGGERDIVFDRQNTTGRAPTDFDDDFPQADLRLELFRPERDDKAFKCRVAARTPGNEKAFTDLVQEIAFAYAGEVNTDWATFKAALP